MNDPGPREENIADEFRRLGKNLVDTLHMIWESPERQNLQKEIEAGLNELGTTLKQEVEAFNQSPSGQRFRSDMEELRTRVQTGEAQSRAREELLSALQQVNTELKKFNSQWTKNSDDSQPTSDTHKEA